MALCPNLKNAWSPGPIVSRLTVGMGRVSVGSNVGTEGLARAVSSSRQTLRIARSRRRGDLGGTRMVGGFTSRRVGRCLGKKQVHLLVSWPVLRLRDPPDVGLASWFLAS